MSTGAFRKEDELLRQAMFVLAAHQEDLAAISASLDDFDKGERGIRVAESLGLVREGFAV